MQEKKYKEIYKNQCIICFKEFSTYYIDAKYCSKYCKSKRQVVPKYENCIICGNDVFGSSQYCQNHNTEKKEKC